MAAVEHLAAFDPGDLAATPPVLPSPKGNTAALDTTGATPVLLLKDHTGATVATQALEEVA